MAMVATILGFQLAAPLLLIACIAFFPVRSRTGFAIQAASTALALSAIALAGLWTLIPWWATYVYAVLFLSASVFSLCRSRRHWNARRSSLAKRLALACYLCLGGVGLVQTVTALHGRIPPGGETVDLAFPFRSGTYLIVNGGNGLLINAHLRTLDPTVPRFRPWRGQSYGVDIVKVDRMGFRADGLLPPAPAAYRIYGTDVFAPCSGTVVLAEDGIQDMRVPQTDRRHMLGNVVILRCGRADVVLAHLRPGSVKVATGSRVAVGALLGEAGNSGNSNEPHLHIHAQAPSAVAQQAIAGDPLPITFGTAYAVRNDRITVP